MIAHNFNKRGICISHLSIAVLDYTYESQEYIYIYGAQFLCIEVKTSYYVAFTDHLLVQMLMI